MSLGLIGCKPPPQVRVEERTVTTVRQDTEKLGGQLIRIAQPGDTLHGIAFINQLDVNKLAAWNDIKDTSRLRVGQRVRLTKPIGFRYPAANTDRAKSDSRSKPSEQTPDEPRVVVTEPLEMPTANSPRTDTGTPSQRADRRANQTNKPGNASVRWMWPTQGKVVQPFALAKGRQGIDIAAPAGQAVTATSPGEVVYVGNSLKGYGNLVIIKHTDEYLSAYAHNKSIFVREGQRVNARQKIGSVGRNNRFVSALHFQIRRNGTPVDPMRYLPKL